MDGMAIGSSDDVTLFAERNREFHDRLYASSGRGQLCRLMMVLRTNVERYIRIGSRIAGNLERVRNDHYEIFNAFRRGDAQTAGRLCREHCAATCERLIARLSQDEKNAAAEGAAG